MAVQQFRAVAALDRRCRCIDWGDVPGVRTRIVEGNAAAVDELGSVSAHGVVATDPRQRCDQYDKRFLNSHM
jgi:hypothetical protein